MLEYVFFDRRPFDRFIGRVRALGLDPVCRQADEQLEVGLPDDLDDSLAEQLEAYYEEMMELNRQLHENAAGAGGTEHQAAGVVVRLQDGRAVYAQVDPGVLSRVMSVLTPAEFGAVVDAVVDAVERPDGRSLCQRLRDSE